MSSRTVVLSTLCTCAAALLPGCTANPAPQGPPATTTSPTAVTATDTPQGSAAPAPSAAAQLPIGDQPVVLDPAAFSPDITNRYWPMPPGRRWTYRESDAGAIREVVVVVTAQTKRIANGITARVVRDSVTENGELIEDTFDWYAQDRQGTVWYLGEETAEFNGGRITSRVGSFEAGVDGAQPGVVVPAVPQPGLKYRQEYYRGHAEDQAEIVSTQETVEVPAGRYSGALLTRESNPLEPGAQENKYYAEGVGPVLAVGLSGGNREELVGIDSAPPTVGTGPLGQPG